MSALHEKMKGFTLVEILVALTLTGLIMILITVGLNLGVRNWESIINIQGEQNRQQSAQWMLRKLIGQARNEVLYDQGGESMIAFEGHPDEVTFVAPLPGASDFNNLYWIRIALESDDNGMPTLQLSYLTYHTQQSIKAGVSEQIRIQEGDDQPYLIDLARDLLQFSENKVNLLSSPGSRLEIDYRHNPDDLSPRWETEWKKQKQLPDLIRVRFFNEQESISTELMIKPQVHNYEVKQLAL